MLARLDGIAAQERRRGHTFDHTKQIHGQSLEPIAVADSPTTPSAALGADVASEADSYALRVRRARERTCCGALVHQQLSRVLGTEPITRPVESTWTVTVMSLSSWVMVTASSVGERQVRSTSP